MKKSLALALVPCAAVVALTAPADAGTSRGGQSLNVAVASSGTGVAATGMKVGSPLVFSGCGYVPGAGVALYVSGPTATTFLGQVAGADGCFSSVDSTGTFNPQNTGSYKAEAFQSSRKRADATVVFSVAP